MVAVDSSSAPGGGGEFLGEGGGGLDDTGGGLLGTIGGELSCFGGGEAAQQARADLGNGITEDGVQTGAQTQS